jgi:membrane-associated phospholipid phosphatase
MGDLGVVMGSLDLYLFHAVNGFCGNWALDRIAAFEEGSNLFKGGILMAAYWWFWFSPDADRRLRHRHIVIGAIAGAIIALALNRALAVTLPFRLRPMYMPGIGYHAPSIPIVFDLENWSSFPSDSATFWFALSFGLFRLHRPVGVLAMIYSTLWMCLTRLYLGIHYPSDLIAGALLGTGVVWGTGAVLKARGAPLLARVVAAEARYPQVFYVTAFLISYENATMFDDVRNFVRRSVRALHAGGLPGIGEGSALFIVAAGALMLGLIVVLTLSLYQRKRHLIAQPLKPQYHQAASGQRLASKESVDA